MISFLALMIPYGGKVHVILFLDLHLLLLTAIYFHRAYKLLKLVKATGSPEAFAKLEFSLASGDN